MIHAQEEHALGEWRTSEHDAAALFDWRALFHEDDGLDFLHAENNPDERAFLLRVLLGGDEVGAPRMLRVRDPRRTLAAFSDIAFAFRGAGAKLTVSQCDGLDNPSITVDQSNAFVVFSQR